MISSTKRPRALGRLTALLGSVAIIVAWAIPLAGMAAAASTTWTISDVSDFEGNGTGTKAFSFAVSRNDSTTAETVYYKTFDSAAIGGTDCAAAATGSPDFVKVTAGVLTFPMGVGFQSLTINVCRDDTLEPDEGFSVELFSDAGMTTHVPGDDTGIGSILNDDVMPTMNINDVSQAEGNSGESAFTFTVSLTSASGTTITTNWGVDPSGANPATEGVSCPGPDYEDGSSPPPLSFAPGETSKTITINVCGETTFEPNETFTVSLSGGTGPFVYGDDHGLGTIINDDPTPPSVSVNDVSQNEGNSGNTPFVFTLTLSAPAPAGGTTVFWHTEDGSATVGFGADYDPCGCPPVVFAAGDTSKTVTVNVNGDAYFEPNQTFYVKLDSATNGVTISDDTGVGTIVNDDTQYSLSIGDAKFAEGDAGSSSWCFLVTLNGAAPNLSTVTVQYSTANGTATEVDPDYVGANGTLTFSPFGSMTQCIYVDVLGDTKPELDETFFVNLMNASGAVIDDGQGLGTILNDDGPDVTINDVTLAEGNSGTTAFNFTVSLSAPAGASGVTVNYASANGTATAGSDYTSVSGTLSFAPGESMKTVTVNVNGDTLWEPNETFFVNLTNAAYAEITDAQGQGMITNDDPLPALSINDVSQNEGDAGTTSFTFTVTKTNDSSQTVTVDYATAAGTATAGGSCAAGVDYVTKSGSLSFAPGEMSKTVTVNGCGDTTLEGDETFFVNLSNPANSSISDSQGMGTIKNDDPNMKISDVSANEGNSGTTAFNFTVTLSSAQATPVTVNYYTLDGTASPPSDYTSTTGTLTFAPGETSKTITVLVNGDTTVEGNETFTVNLWGQTAGVLMADSQGVGTIVNDDTAPPPPSDKCPGYESSAGNHILGTPGDDIIYGTNGNDIICGLGGNDVIYGQDGNDTILGNDGDDVLRGGNGRDTIYGDAGNDTLYGNRGWDYLNGGDGTDAGWGGRGSDTRVNCESGRS